MTKLENMKIYKLFRTNEEVILANRNCLNVIDKIPDNYIQLAISSPPYFIGKEYDTSKSTEDFRYLHLQLFNNLIPKLKEGGSICWQTGYHVQQNQLLPLDYLVYSILNQYQELKLRNRIVWTYGHGLHTNSRFSGRHEVILWFTKGKNYVFNLDDVRVPQKYPGKKYYKGDKKGQFSGNPLGKNPSDVWNIPNVKANHKEKTIHPCQFPIALVKRLILSLTNENDYVIDPFMGVGSSGAASILTQRRFIGCETEKKYYDVAVRRCKEASSGKLEYRPLNKPIFTPNGNTTVAKKPSTFLF